MVFKTLFWTRCSICFSAFSPLDHRYKAVLRTFDALNVATDHRLSRALEKPLLFPLSDVCPMPRLSIPDFMIEIVEIVYKRFGGFFIKTKYHSYSPVCTFHSDIPTLKNKFPD